MYKAVQNGKYIKIESEDDKREMLNLPCACGHELRDHFFHNAYGSTKTVETGGCLKSNHCQQFRIKTKSAESYQYA